MLHARARANRVLPVPGGPYNSTPFGGLMPTRRNSIGFVSGSSMTSQSSRICSFKPPILENDTFPASSFSMWYTVGSTSRASISTATLSGRAFVPTAERAWMPFSPNTFPMVSEAPLMTAGCCEKPSTQLTKPTSFTTRLILSKSPTSSA
ncbi:hypothetical protein PsorP6_004848 [Peronosclerospora sorghi]|uniref:Uncharacterized protein n=1 Tax=Peronosclerospora sorghi TaxID=230839 RepID=A0ACC0W1Y6_9STRA|nr:hypothetical protein PsorP6_004848 [Peronosclerospora sorghi]